MHYDRRDFEALIERYAGVISAAIKRVCGHRFAQSAQDVRQEVYLALWKHLESGKKVELAHSYLYKVAFHAALAFVRKHDKYPSLEDQMGGPDVADNRNGQQQTLEKRQALGKALDQLPPDQHRAVKAYLAGFNHTEVASFFGWTESVARHRIYRGLAALKGRLKDHG